MSRMKVRAIIEHQGKYLLVRIKSDDSFWCLPGGGMEPGEDIISALERELIEETGIKPQIGNLLYVAQIQTDDGYTLPEFFFHVTNGEDYLNIDLQSTSHGEQEITEISFKELTGVRLLPTFLIDELPEIAQVAFGVPTRIRTSALQG